VPAEQAGSTRGDIIAPVEQVSSSMKGIALAPREQSAGIAQVNDGVTPINEVTQQNATLSR
jgi:methyl-accepting chemotaxis protein